jgi:transaldolase/glucose-6-phosphate isomerase
VSLEVSPELAHEEDATVSEALRLFRSLGRPNVMIKVPATDEGIPAVRRLLGYGVNVNVTLIFSPSVYRRVAEAYVAGLRDLVADGGDPARIGSVASFFVSRIDSAADKRLDDLKSAGDILPETHRMLRGAVAVANAKVAYRCYRDVFEATGFDDLRSLGARPQRVLWASTSTKDPAYADLKYVETLVGKQTVNTMPQETLEAFLDHGKVVPDAVSTGEGDAEAVFHRLAEAGIDFEGVCADLLANGVDAFAKSFRELLGAIQRVL